MKFTEVFFWAGCSCIHPYEVFWMQTHWHSTLKNSVRGICERNTTISTRDQFCWIWSSLNVYSHGDWVVPQTIGDSPAGFVAYAGPTSPVTGMVFQGVEQWAEMKPRSPGKSWKSKKNSKINVSIWLLSSPTRALLKMLFPSPGRICVSSLATCSFRFVDLTLLGHNFFWKRLPDLPT